MSWDITNVRDTANDEVNDFLIDAVSEIEMTLKLIHTMRSVPIIVRLHTLPEFHIIPFVTQQNH